MMKKTVVVWLVVLMVVGGMTGFVSMSINASKASCETMSRSSSQSKSHTAHAPIYIDGNSQFTAANGVTSGSGTEGDPYIIENWDISASSANGIYILNTDAYFVIRNCTVHDGGSNEHDGINFYKATNGKIENVSSYNNLYGIYFDYGSNNHIITNCDLSDNRYDGIWLLHSSNNNISKSNIHSTHSESGGIFLSYSSNNNIKKCDISSGGYGICVWSSDNNVITACRVYENEYGIWLRFSSNTKLRDNILDDNTYNFGVYGAGLSDFRQDIDTSNTINDKPIYYIVGENNRTFNWTMNIGYLGLVSCVNITVEHLELKDNYRGLLMAYTTYSTVRECNIYNNYDGIGLISSSNIDLTSSSNNNINTCNVFGNYNNGIHLSGTSNNNVTNCTLYNNSEKGIYLDCSSNNYISICHLYDNHYGAEFKHSSNSEIHYCNIYNNTDYGFYSDAHSWEGSVNAIYNWWGSADGPSGVGPGSGDPVSDKVIYNPWLTEPVNISPPNTPPIVSFTYSPDSPTTEDIIQFTDLSWDISGDIVSWYWNFGDGNTSTDQNPQHKYSAAGNYTVKLTVTDDDGLNATYTKLITVKEGEAITNGGTTNGGQPSGGENKQGINFNYVVMIIGVIAVCIIIGAVLVKRRGKTAAKTMEKKTEKTTMGLRCPKCKKIFRVEVKPKPFKIKCPYCGKEGVVR